MAHGEGEGHLDGRGSDDGTTEMERRDRRRNRIRNAAQKCVSRVSWRSGGRWEDGGILGGARAESIDSIAVAGRGVSVEDWCGVGEKKERKCRGRVSMVVL